MELTTIGFANYPFSPVARRTVAKPVTEPAEVKVTVYNNGEGQWGSAHSSRMLRLTSVSVEPLESHPVDHLLPQSRLQQMKKLLQS